MNTCRYIKTFFVFLDNILHLDVHYVCLLVQHFEPQGRRFTNFHYYYYNGLEKSHSSVGYTRTYLGSKLQLKTYFRPFSSPVATFARHLDGVVLELTICFGNVYMRYKHGSNTISHHGNRNRIGSQDFHGSMHSLTDRHSVTQAGENKSETDISETGLTVSVLKQDPNIQTVNESNQRSF